MEGSFSTVLALKNKYSNFYLGYETRYALDAANLKGNTQFIQNTLLNR